MMIINHTLTPQPFGGNGLVGGFGLGFGIAYDAPPSVDCTD